jgi:hypothetical protein
VLEDGRIIALISITGENSLLSSPQGVVRDKTKPKCIRASVEELNNKGVVRVLRSTHEIGKANHTQGLHRGRDGQVIKGLFYLRQVNFENIPIFSSRDKVFVTVSAHSAHSKQHPKSYKSESKTLGPLSLFDGSLPSG